GKPQRFGLFPVRSPLLGESRLISFPPGTEMFQFPGLASFRMTRLASGRVSPFGPHEITARVQLPQAYRSLPRPSSPLDAKASTVCLIAFDLTSFGSLLRCDSFPRTLPGQGATSAHHSTFGCQRAAKVWEGSRSSAGDTRSLSRRHQVAPYSAFQKGGDPAAGSPTATLLRLRPSH